MAILIKNNEARILGAGLPGDKHPLLLKPGINSVSEDKLEVLQSNEHFKALFDGRSPALEFVQPQSRKPAPVLAPAPVAAPEPFDITGVNVGEAQELIKATFDKALLNAWDEMDARSTVKKAVAAQLERLASEE